MVEVSIIAAFIAGLISFASPCVLPLIPGFLAYLAGTGAGRLQVFLNSVAYVLGFATVFALLGVLLNSLLSTVAYDVQLWLSRLGGVIIIVFGLHLTTLITLPFLNREASVEVKKGSVTYLSSFLFGAAFAVGWTPCVGPVLGSVLALAASQPGSAVVLLLSYSLGLGIPFLLVGAFSTQAAALIKRSHRFLRYFNIVVGVLLIVIGILVFTQTLNLIANWSLLNSVLLE
jgi:cytochrome c-type biogenesis protein